MSASLSACRAYRYRIDRNIDMFGDFVLGFCLHNPSTADAVADDPTLRRCIGFAKTFGASRLILVNLWAARSTSPSALWRMADPVGPENDAHIADAADEVAASGGYMIAGWGTPQPPAPIAAVVTTRVQDVVALIADQSCHLRALGTTRDGNPRHPLYVAASERSRLWPAPTPTLTNGARHERAPA